MYISPVKYTVPYAIFVYQYPATFNTMKNIISKIKRKEEPSPQRPLQISGPTDMILQVPRQQRDANGVPIKATDHQIDLKTMQAALTNMAEYLDSKGQTLTVITVGGAVNLLLLRSRQTTHDVDFFGTNLTNSQRVALEEAAKFAENQSSAPLGAEWFNNATQLWLSQPLHRQLTDQAIQQNEIVFQRGGLTVIAAPWMYAFASKMHRVAQSRRGERGASARPYDPTDAAAYLHKYIQTREGRAPVESDVQARCGEYGFLVDAIDLQAVNDEHRRLYHVDGIVKDTRGQGDAIAGASTAM